MVTSAAPPPTLAKIAGWPINIATQAQAVSEIVAAASSGDNFAVFTLNLDHLDKLKHDARFRAAYAQARFVTADGAPVAFLASLQGARVERTTGADLVVPLACAAAERSLPIYLFGTRPDVLVGAAAYLRARAGPGLSIVGQLAPERDFDPDGPAADAAMDAIAASGARLCFVALGAPKQELFAARASARDGQTGYVCVGAALDFLVGAQTRAPVVMQRYGMEWLWRLATNPGRLAARYTRCVVVVAEIAVIGPAKQRLAKLFSGA